VSTDTVLYDHPGPRAKARNLVLTIVFGIALVALLYWIYTRFDEKGQWAGALWQPFTESSTWTDYIVPGLMSWQQSGDMMFMVILGGMASTAGPVLGTFALLFVEELLKGWTEHWQVILGPLLILSVIFFRRGLAGIFYKPDA